VGVSDGGRTAGLQQGNDANTERIFLMALHKAEEFGLEDRRMAVSLSPPAQGHAGQRKYVEVESVYLQTLKIYQAVHGEFHAAVAATLNILEVLHRMYGRYAQAESWLTRALTVKEKLLGLDHRDVSLSVVNLAQLRVVQGQPEKAEPLYRRALAIRERALGPSHPEVAKTLEEPCQCPTEIRACRRGGLAGATCQKLSPEAELNRSRHPV
jgi:tetratricopeptide (TPR) repeat protein